MAKAKLCREPGVNHTIDMQDPVLAMLGVGKHLWERESGDQFIERLRLEDDSPDDLPGTGPVNANENLPEAVWQRLEQARNQQFHTATGLPFTFEVEGNGIWFFRDGKRVNRKLTRSQAEVAISRCPLKSTTEIKDLIDYPYLYAILMDKRIRGDSW